jgi:ABC-type phosphate transport system substrate-binding protein
MKKRITFIISAAFIILSATASVKAQNLMVISNSKGVPSELNRTELMAVMKGEKQRWSDGTRISIALMKSSTATGEVTSKKIYGMSGDEVNKYWLALVFQGKAKAPVFFNSANELESYISQTPGAIGIVEESPDVKLKPVTIDGKKSL